MNTLLLSSYLTIFSVCVSFCVAADPTGGSADEIKAVLRPDKHLTYLEMLRSKKGDAHSIQYQKQVQSIRDVGRHKFAELIPNILEYLDYPSSPIAPLMTSVRLKTEAERISETRDVWPAYDALLMFREEAVEPLESFLMNKSKGIELRIAVLAVLMDIDEKRARSVGKELLASTKEHSTASEGIAAVLRGERFWGALPTTYKEPSAK